MTGALTRHYDTITEVRPCENTGKDGNLPAKENQGTRDQKKPIPADTLILH